MLSHVVFNQKEETYSYKTPQEFNMEFDLLAGELYSHEVQARHFKALAEKIKSDLKKLCNGTPHMTQSFAFMTDTRKGNVDYSKIPELNGVDLDDYRKKNVVSWKLSKI